MQFDAAVDYEKGETPMTVCQLESFVKLFRENKTLTAEAARLKAERTRILETN